LISALPFEHPPTGDVYVKASKLTVNAAFKWKEAGVDRSGNVYEPVRIVEPLSNALAVLETRGIINEKEKLAIIRELMQK